MEEVQADQSAPESLNSLATLEPEAPPADTEQEKPAADLPADDSNGAVETESSEPDYRTLYEESRGTLEKLERDTRSQRIQGLKTEQRDSELQSMRAEMRAMAKTLGAMAEAQVSGDPDNLTSRMAEIEEEVGREGAANRITQEATAAWEELTNVVPEADLRSKDEYSEVRNLWDSGLRQPMVSAVPFWRAVTKALQVAQQGAESSFEERLSTERNRAQQSRKEALEEVEANDLSTGPSSGGTMSDEGFMQRFGDADNPLPMTSENLKRAQDIRSKQRAGG